LLFCYFFIIQYYIMNPSKFKKKGLSSKLSLKTTDISETNADAVSTDSGYWSSGRITQTYFINMRNVLGGKVFDENQYFALQLNSINMVGFGTSWTSNSSDLIPIILVSGLNWYNNGYNQKTQQNTKNAYIGFGQFTASTNTSQTITDNSNTIYWAKTQENIELTLTFNRNYASGGVVQSTTGTGLPFGSFYFTCYACEAEPDV